MITTIVSDGLDGASRGALDAAIQLDIGYGGWTALTAELPAIYADRMRRSATPDAGLAHRLNVQDSDATLIITFAETLDGSSAFVARAARQQRKPCKHLGLPARGQTRIPDAVRSALLEWIRDSRIEVLHVAGSREADEPGIQLAARDALAWIFEDEVMGPVATSTPEDDFEDPTGEQLVIRRHEPDPGINAIKARPPRSEGA